MVERQVKNALPITSAFQNIKFSGSSIKKRIKTASQTQQNPKINQINQISSIKKVPGAIFRPECQALF